jgi:hypothetical protein
MHVLIQIQNVLRRAVVWMPKPCHCGVSGLPATEAASSGSCEGIQTATGPERLRAG